MRLWSGLLLATVVYSKPPGESRAYFGETGLRFVPNYTSQSGYSTGSDAGWRDLR